jgi:hypothetical protein
MRLVQHLRQQRGQSILELIFLLPIYILLTIFVVQFTTMYFKLFHDMSVVRNTALEKGRHASSMQIVCHQQRRTHSFLSGLTGPTKNVESRVTLFAMGSGSPICPS